MKIEINSQLPKGLKFYDVNGWVAIMNERLETLETGRVDWRLKELTIRRGNNILKEVFANNDFLVTYYEED